MREAKSAPAPYSASNVDGIYDQDPRKNPDAKRYEQLSFAEALAQGLERTPPPCSVSRAPNQRAGLRYGYTRHNQSSLWLAAAGNLGPRLTTT